MKRLQLHLTTLCILLVAACANLQGTVERSSITDSQTWEESFTVDENADFKLACRESDVFITTWDQNRVDVKVTLTVEAYEREELDKMLAAFKPSISGSNRGVSVQNPDCISETVTNRQTKIRINNQVIKVKSYRYRFEIRMPASNDLNAKVRFSTIKLGEHRNKVNLELYECEVTGNGINSLETIATLKFCDGTLGAARRMRLNTYESNLTLKTIKSLQSDLKFSNLRFEGITDAEITAYETDLDLGKTNLVRLDHNFGKTEISEARRLRLNAYEMELSLGQIDELIISNGRFSKVDVGKAGYMFMVGYESSVILNSVDSLELDARFCDVDVGLLQKSLKVSGYESDLRFSLISAQFNKISIDARFTQAELHLAKNSGYQLESNIAYGQLEIPESDLTGIRVERKGNNVKATGRTKDYNGDARVEISGYETKVRLHRD